MNNLKEALWKEYENAEILLGGMTVSSDEYKKTLEYKTNILNGLLKLEQLEEEGKRDKTHNWINGITFGVNFVGGLWMVSKTFKFDQTATITSTLGRNILNGALPKMFKR